MKQIDSSFAQTLLVIAIIAAIFVIGFLWWDNNQNTNIGAPRSNNLNQTIPQLTPTPTPPKTDSINSIESDFNKIDSTQYETQVDAGQTQLGVDASGL